MFPVTYINIVNVQDFWVELKTQGFCLLYGVSQLTVRLHNNTRE